MSFAGGLIGAALYLATLAASIAGSLHWTHNNAGGALLAVIAVITVIVRSLTTRRR